MDVTRDGEARSAGTDTWQAALAAAEAWWREAGVDTGFTDEARDWLAEALPPASAKQAAKPNPTARKQQRPPSPSPETIGGDRARWPQDLAAFRDWWLAEPSLGIAGEGRRVLPRGQKEAAVMVLVPQPEAQDGERLLSGPQGRLLKAVLAALGLREEEVYCASTVPAHAGLLDWDLLRERGMGEVLAHHVALVRPRRLLVFDRGGISALLGHDSAREPSALPNICRASGQVPMLCVPTLQGLIERAGRKAEMWRTLLKWMGEE